MRSKLRKTLRILWKSVLYVLMFVILYVTVTFLLSRIPVNTTDNDQAKDVPIYISTNGVHTDVIFPLKTAYFDWSKTVSIAATKAKDSTRQFVAFGWGDRGFYLNTPEWSDLKLSTACEAAFYLGTSAMHVTFLHEPNETESCRKIWISHKEYAQMTDFVVKSLQTDPSGNAMPIADAGYGNNDAFYEAKGKYNLFYTCNSWANNALKSGDQKAALWTLTDGGIFCHY